jgi:hypothetical protein
MKMGNENTLKREDSLGKSIGRKIQVRETLNLVIARVTAALRARLLRRS